ncbi:MAG TPA: hypothetical protein ENI13_02110 [candidate division CPR3 bacterium]|uniref:Uncharacterized protein n=1 Tax=candidate division CPR3 bacterium TaxID=2268181 RepID=A0A7C1SQ33_UNCC3|nr:hypothetical protein [candidate division CPR3 bacterium]
MLKISKEGAYALIKRDKEFSATIKEAVLLAEAWWMTMGRKNLRRKTFRDVLWYMNMKNRFGWKDKHDVTSGDKPLAPAQVVKLPIRPGNKRDKEK